MDIPECSVTPKCIFAMTIDQRQRNLTNFSLLPSCATGEDTSDISPMNLSRNNGTSSSSPPNPNSLEARAVGGGHLQAFFLAYN